jgi:hypothetical protein
MNTATARSLVEELLARGAEEGCLPLSDVERLAERLELGDEETEALYEQIDEQRTSLRDDCGRVRATGPST